jgi:hypothetical protein
MSWKIDKLEVTDDAMGGAVIDVKELSAALRTRLESPFPQQGQSGDWWELYRELGDVMESYEDMIIIQSTDNPIFRESEIGGRQNKEIMTQYKSNLDKEGEFRKSATIFIMIDFDYFKNYSINVARKQMNSWCKYISYCLDEITPNSPKLIIHVRSDDEEIDPITLYNKKYHSLGLDPKEYDLVPEAPIIIIDCAPIKNHLKNNYNSKEYFDPDFFLMYSTITNEERNPDVDIRNSIRKISNGFTIVHRTSPDMNVVAKILEFTCKLAIRQTIHTRGSNLFEDFTDQTFASSRRIDTSKSASLIGEEIYTEMGQTPDSMYGKLSHSWQGYQGDGFYKMLKEYDEMCETLDYDTKIDIRSIYERLRRCLLDFLIVNEWFNAPKWNKIGESTRRSEHLLFAHTYENQQMKKEAKADLKAKISQGIIECERVIQLDTLLENEDSENPIEGKRKEVNELFKILYKCMDGDTFHYLSRPNHPISSSDVENLEKANNIDSGDKPFSELIKLQKHNVKFGLIKHISAHKSLETFLNTIKKEINNCENPEVRRWICKFFNLKPIDEGDSND